MKQQLAFLVALATTFVSAAASAAYVLPAPVATALSDMGAAWGLIEAQIWPILATVVIGFFVIKMFKKGANKVG
ncbi:major coat protein [Pseudomonas leptonychotis]|uniref:major coat protein n=1 Tax=Pseudomonas leptonychotis TaxID=2448482 RepID=UPI00386C7DC0